MPLATTPPGPIGRRVRLRTQGQPIESLADFALIAEDDGTRLTVEQLGQIEFEGLDRGIALYYQGQPAIRIQVERGPDGDAIALQESVERAVAIFNEQSADGVAPCCLGRELRRSKIA